MGNPDLIFAVAGVAALLAATLPQLLSRRPFSLPLACLLCGLLLYLLPLELPDADPIAHRALVEHATEICVLISLMGAGLAINRPFGRRSWSSTWRLLGWTLPLTVLGVAAAAQRTVDVAAARLGTQPLQHEFRHDRHVLADHAVSGPRDSEPARFSNLVLSPFRNSARTASQVARSQTSTRS